MKSSLALLLLVTACTVKTPAASSSAVLSPERTWVIVSKPAQPAALDVVRMFHDRGYELADMQSDQGGVVLRFKGERKVVSEQIVTPLDVLAVTAEVAEALDSKAPRHHHHHEPTIETYELGSVYYVRVEPRGETMTSIAAIGRPTRNGIEACTGEADLIAPCMPLAAGDDVHPEIAGYAEAELINGVFSQLRLEGWVVSADPAVGEANRRCWALRRDREQRAARVSDPRAKAGILRTAPVCEGAAPSLASK